MGKLLPVGEISDREVSIAHRPKRDIYDGLNAGISFKASQSQHRVRYDEILGWPIINKFPVRLHSDPVLNDVSWKEFYSHCPVYTVLPDFWKYWALKLKIELGDRWRLDFSTEGTLARNFVPHGAAATVRDSSENRRFIV